MTAPDKLIIIIPAFNEQDSIANTVQQVRGVFDRLSLTGLRPLLYVIDDGSTDETAKLATQAGADRVLRHPRNQGLGAAVRTGLTHARHDGAQIVVKFDADLQHDPLDIAGLVQPLVDGAADVVYGHRFNRIDYPMPWVRRTGNRFFSWLLRALTGWPIRDSQPGILAVNAVYLDVFRLPGDYNYTQQILLDAYHKGMRFADHDVSFRQRRSGRSFVTYKYPAKVLAQIFWVIVYTRPMKIFGPVGLVFLMVAAGIAGFELWQWWVGAAIKPVVHVNAVLAALIVGLQTFFFGVLAELIIHSRRN
jgi:glycosyltransferase involved in cell wall biosynthesis